MKKTEPTSAATEKAWEHLVATLAAQGATTGSMFGMTSLKARTGKAFAGLYGDAIVFKLGAPTHAAALALAGASLFDPSGMGRPMKEWVVVPRAHAKHWEPFGAAALATMEGAIKVPPKPAKPVKPAASPARASTPSKKTR